jgi:inorganic triphosphatase YgiF
VLERLNDTAGDALRKQGKTLRIRRTGRSDPIMTLKWRPSAAEGPFVRGEAEVRHPGSYPNIFLGLSKPWPTTAGICCTPKLAQ